MIKSKNDYKKYLYEDELQKFNGKGSFVRKLKAGEVWKFHKILRKTEYLSNCKSNIYIILKLFYKYKLKRIESKLGWSIPLNVFEGGLNIVHIGTVIINQNCRFGKNARIHACVNVGASGGNEKAPIFGDNIYIAPGAKIFGDIKIGSNIAIGANSVVNKSFLEEGITIAGIPAKKISEKGTERMIALNR